MTIPEQDVLPFVSSSRDLMGLLRDLGSVKAALWADLKQQ